MEPNAERRLPENAYRKLKQGEVFSPVIAAGERVPEWTARSVLIGLIMAAVFSAAAAFLGFKVGQVFEAAIPIAILAVGIGTALPRRSTLLENVIVQSIGAASGLVVAGSIFTLPGLFILGLPVDLFKLFLVALFGGVMGILFFIPLRRYFVRDMHGEYPFPEATATTEILVAGEAGGQQAKVLAAAAGVGGLFDFVAIHFQGFGEVFTTRSIPGLAWVADKARMVCKIDVLASVLGLGFIIGLRYAVIICAGSFAAWFGLVPLLGWLGDSILPAVGIPLTKAASAMSAEELFKGYVRLVGIGGIACAGLLGIIRNWRIIQQAFSLGFKELGGKKGVAAVQPVRTDRDFPMKWVLLGIFALLVSMFLFFSFGVLGDQPNGAALAGITLAVVVLIAFLFTTVAAQATATVGSNPVSGMTLMTLIVASLVLVKLGLTGNAGMLAALLIGGVVCTALSTAGGFVTDLKVGYWLGATPAVQQRSKLIGTLVASLTVGSVILLLNNVYGFVETPATPHPLPAPQANAMVAVIKTMMSAEAVPWALYGFGVGLILLLALVFKVPALPFALGMYLPIELNTPLLVGGAVAHFVMKSARGDEKLAQARNNRGTLIASGFIAGGAIMGVVAALLKWFSQGVGSFKVDLGVGLFHNAEGVPAELVAIVLYAALVVYLYWDSKRVK
jgi:putative OPT family oligopeptide transporter